MANNVGATIAKQCTSIAHEIQGATRQAVDDASLVMKRSIESEIRKVAPSMRLSGVGKSGARVGVRYDIKGTRNPTSIVKAFGPLHLVERDTKPHDIYPRGRTTTRRGRARKGAKALFFNELYSANVAHPGTTGRRPFEKGVDAARKTVLRILNSAHSRAIVRGLRGRP